MSRSLPISPLTQAGFAPFGQVIETAGHTPIAINQGYCQRFDDLAKLDVTAKQGRPVLSIFRSQALETPLYLHQMERHLLASQAFIPLGGRPWLVVVAPAGKFARAQMRGFVASGKQGVNFAPGTWHHFSLALDQSADFLVIDRAAMEPDCEEIKLEPAILLEVPR